MTDDNSVTILPYKGYKLMCQFLSKKQTKKYLKNLFIMLMMCYHLNLALTFSLYS